MGDNMRWGLTVLWGGALLISFGAGCAGNGDLVYPDGGLDDGGPRDAARLPECTVATQEEDCPDGFVCQARQGVPTCVRDPNPAPPGDGTDCSPCPAPGECRRSVCIQPSDNGHFCEFDDGCASGELCIAGRCTVDPRETDVCGGDAPETICPGATECGSDGRCHCDNDTDCPLNLVCGEGICVAADDAECISDADCEGERFCDRGQCQSPALCDVSEPLLTGEWEVETVIHVDDALPTWITDFLAAVRGPFRFLSGETTCIDFGLADWIEEEICALVRPFVDDFLPEWAIEVFRAVSDLDYVFGEWTITERMTLASGEVPDAYRGTREWLTVEFDHRGLPIEGDTDTIADWRFAPTPFNASAVCGTFHVERHDVHISVGSLIAWLLDQLVYEATGRRHETAGAALANLGSGFCSAFANLVVGEVTGAPYETVFNACDAFLTRQIDSALRNLLDARLGASPMTMRGWAPIPGMNSLRPGHWDGTLLGNGFTGTFDATR